MTCADIGEYNRVPSNPEIFNPYEASEKVRGTLPEFIILIVMVSPFLKSVFSVKIESDGPCRKFNSFGFLKSTKITPRIAPATTPTQVAKISPLGIKGCHQFFSSL